MFYKTNEEQLGISIDEFVNEWYEQQEYLLVDIRENDELERDGNIKGAFHMSMYDIPENIEMAPTYIVCILCCDNGIRSEQVAKYAKNYGLNNGFYLEGGLEELFKAVPELKG
jgi:rhodanese-related sulfurtransferase